MWGPPVISWFRFAPITISTINNIVIGVICTNWTLSWGPHIVWINMVTFTINIHPMLAYIPAPWILWVMGLVWINMNGINDNNWDTNPLVLELGNGKAQNLEIVIEILLASWPCRALGFDIVVSWSLFLLVGKCRKTSSEIKYLDVSDVYLSIPLETKHRSVRLLSSIVRCKTSQPWLSGASGVGAGNIAEHGAASNLIVDELISSLSFNYIIYIYIKLVGE